MPKQKVIAGVTLREEWTIERYEVMQPVGRPRSEASAAITIVQRSYENDVMTVESRNQVGVNGVMPDGVTGRVQDLNANYITPAQQAALDAGLPLAQAYDAGTVNGMYAWVQTNRPDVIPADAE